MSKENREVFENRFAFYFAAVGSAVGFGNVWRFPQLAYSYGGGAFFIPYILALFLIGIPVLFLEISLGQYYQRGDISVFGGIHERMRGVGLISISCSYILLGYYSMLLTWVVRTLFESGTSSAPWSNETIGAGDAIDYFFQDIIGMSSLPEGSLYATRLVWQNCLYSMITYFLIFVCSAFGLKLTGRITYVTMGLPVLLLFIFLIRGATLDGASDGIKQYIGQWDLKVLRDEGAVWSEAVSQIFFSLSVTFGVMTAYGSHMKKDEPAFLNSLVVALANSIFSFIAGFAVFSALGHMAFTEGMTFTELDEAGLTRSFGLVFGTWPVVLGSLPGGIHWVRLLFVNLILLGLDSAFSFIEGLTTCLLDTKSFSRIPKWSATLIFCAIGYLLSLVYATDAGLFFLDAVDWYVNFVMLFVGFLETFTVGWIYGIEKKLETFGPGIFFSYLIGTFGSILLASSLWFGLEENALWAGFLAWALFYFAGIGCTFFLLATKGLLKVEMIKDLVFGNMLDFKDELFPVIGWVPLVWCLLIKHFIPQILLILFVNLAASNKFRYYGGYPMWPYQFLGILIVTISIAVFLIGLVLPNFYSGLVSYEEKVGEKDEVEVENKLRSKKKMEDLEASE